MRAQALEWIALFSYAVRYGDNRYDRGNRGEHAALGDGRGAIFVRPKFRNGHFKRRPFHDGD